MASQTTDYAVYNLGGLNTYVNPFLQTKGQFFRLLNVDPLPYGGKTKRPGYSTFLNNPDNSQVNTMFSWRNDDGSKAYVYRASGSVLYYYDINGTVTSWNICGNGTIGNGTHVGHETLDNVLIIGDGSTSTRHTTNGTSFTNTSLAPIGEHFAQYQNSIYLGGTASTLFKGCTNDATNWSTVGTSDSTSFQVPGEGRIDGVFKASDRIIADKSAGNRFRWDGESLVDLATNLAYTSPYSLGSVEGYRFGLNRLGVYGFNGSNPEIVSNPIQNQIYNDQNTGIAGTVFETAPGVVHKYDYFLSMGSIRDDFTNYPINNAIGKYNFQQNTWSNAQFYNNPTSYVSYKDYASNQQLLFGDSTGQCYLYGGTATTDNGNAIESQMAMFIHCDLPQFEKEFRLLHLAFNPGCQAQVQVSSTDTFLFPQGGWVSAGDVSRGAADIHLPQGTRGRFLWLLIKESSKGAPFCFYGLSVGYNLIPNQ